MARFTQSPTLQYASSGVPRALASCRSPASVGTLVEELVVGVLQCFGEVLGPVGPQKRRVGTVLTPALVAGAEGNVRRMPARPVVGERRVPVDDARFKAPEAGERLEGRCGRLAGRDRTVD